MVAITGPGSAPLRPFGYFSHVGKVTASRGTSGKLRRMQCGSPKRSSAVEKATASRGTSGKLRRMQCGKPKRSNAAAKAFARKQNRK